MNIEQIKHTKEPEYNFNPSENVRLFLEKYGERGQIVLEIFNKFDPRARYFGEGVNPDEYIPHAERFFHNIKFYNKSVSEEKIKSAVLDSFSDGLEEDGFLKEEELEKIAKEIFVKFYKSI